jgi:dipeptidyl aminopeptidase/acylaminoacyl peptidase
MRSTLLLLPLMLLGCGNAAESPTPARSSPGAADGEASQTLREARDGFTTKIVRDGEAFGPPEAPPPGSEFELIHYDAPVGPLAAYLAKDPGDGQRHPAIVWITGGDNNSIGDVWSPADRSNDQTASGFRRAGIVMMFPSQRGGNDNPGRREGFYGEVDDILAATDHLATLPYVDPERIYLGGHSTGGTMVMLVAACSDRYQAVFALGPVAAADHYGGEFLYCNPSDQQEVRLRSPMHWLHGVQRPLYVIEGVDGNWPSIEMMEQANTNPQVQFLRVPGHDHFSVIAPVVDLLAGQVVAGRVQLTPAMMERVR